MSRIDDLIAEAVSLIDIQAQAEAKAEWEQLEGTPEKYWEPAIAKEARDYCYDILDAGKVEDLSGCPLCQG